MGEEETFSSFLDPVSGKAPSQPGPSELFPARVPSLTQYQGRQEMWKPDSRLLHFSVVILTLNRPLT